jgi:hypothetical protein
MTSWRSSICPGPRYHKAEVVLVLALTAIFFDLGLEFMTVERVISGSLHRLRANEKS